MYQIGNAQRPDHTDPRFETEQEAIDAAQRLCTGDQVFAIWRWENNDTAETIHLVYQGDLWKLA